MTQHRPDKSVDDPVVTEVLDHATAVNGPARLWTREGASEGAKTVSGSGLDRSSAGIRANTAGSVVPPVGRIRAGEGLEGLSVHQDSKTQLVSLCTLNRQNLRSRVLTSAARRIVN